jgi:hypothetical protein
LSGGGDIAINREMGEESGNLILTHIIGMTFVVEEDEPADPVDVGLLGAKAVMLHPQMPPDAIEQSRRSGGEFGGNDHSCAYGRLQM